MSQQPGAERMLAEDERRATRGAALLCVNVGEQRTFLGDAVNVRRVIAHQPQIVGADVVPADRRTLNVSQGTKNRNCRLRQVVQDSVKWHF